jgi:hypothetical protein
MGNFQEFRWAMFGWEIRAVRLQIIGWNFGGKSVKLRAFNFLPRIRKTNQILDTLTDISFVRFSIFFSKIQLSFVKFHQILSSFKKLFSSIQFFRSHWHKKLKRETFSISNCCVVFISFNFNFKFGRRKSKIEMKIKKSWFNWKSFSFWFFGWNLILYFWQIFDM